jgi:hypothetical protein
MTPINQTQKTRLAILSIAIAVGLFAGLAIVPAIDTITPAFGENPHKDNPGDKDQGKGNDPPNKHHKNRGNN